MTTFSQPQAAPIRWMSAAELSATSGLRQDLVVRFIPSAGLSGQLYSDHHIALARLVKQLTDVGTHESVVDAVVRDLRDRPDINISDKQKSTTWRWATALGATALATLILGGIVGGLIGAGNRSTPAAEPAPQATVTTQAPTPAATIPAKPDPVCADWTPIQTDYHQQRAEWEKTDPAIPAAQWSSSQRKLSMDVVPVMRSEAAAMRSLAAKAADPELRVLMVLKAEYEDAYADRLPNYVPENDSKLWVAATDFSNAVNSLCSATVPR